MIFLTYLLKSSVCAAILWIAYYALFRKETHFVFNRFYLLSVIPLSSIIPLLRLPLLPPAEHVSFITIEDFSVAPLAETATQSFPTATLLLVIYFSGAGFVAFRFIKQLHRLHRIMAASRFSDTKNYSAFTFFRKIHINKNTLSAGDYEKVLWHEQVHARQLHSVDLVVAQLFVMIQWFNPFAWRLKKSIVATHEYLADAQVLAHGIDVNIYQQLLFNQTAGVYPEYVSGFSYSLIKKRLIMMTKSNTGKFFALKLCGLLPVIALPVALFGLSTAEIASPVNPEASITITDTTNIVSITIEDVDSGEKEEITAAASGVVIFDTNNKQKADSIPIEDIGSINIRKNTAKEEISVTMKSGETIVFNANDARELEVLNPDDISSITIRKDTTKTEHFTAPKTEKAISVMMKSWETIVFNANDAQELEVLNPDDISSITIQKDTAKTKKGKVHLTVEEEKVYTADGVDVNPEFPGGQDAMMKFIYDNLRYPIEAFEKNIQGRVTVEFTIHADGNIRNVKTQKSVDPLLDAEAERVVKAMPAWTPGKHKGSTVAVRFFLPIMFQLSQDKAAAAE